MRLQRKKKTRTQTQAEGAFIQPKLKVGQPGDKYEVEADTMADKVVSKTSSNSEGAIQKKGTSEEEVQQKPLASSITPLVQTSMFKDKNEGAVQKMEEEEPVQAMEEEEPVQKQEEEEAVQEMEEEESVQAMEEEESVQAMEEEESVQAMEEEESVQAKCDECENEESVQKMGEEEEVQTKSKSNSPIESKLKNSKGKGNPISGDTKNEMESGFGADFSNVNIHTDANAIQMSQELGAQAFTHGNDVYFNKGKYNPNSKSGKHLLAHELTHTVQQSGMVNKKIQKKHKLENDPKDAPSAMSCNIANSSASGIQMSINHGIGSSNLSASDKSMLSNLAMNWHASGGTDVIRIDGFASIDGKPELNWGLSCDRAEKVAQELMHPSDGSKGIPLTSIKTFANGETNQFSKSLGPNRRAMMTIPKSVPPPTPKKKKPKQKTITLNVVHVKGSSGNVSSAINYANNEVYYQANIKVVKGKEVTLSRFISTALIGSDLVLEEFSSATSPTTEERALLPLNQKNNQITLFYVKKLSKGSLGENFRPGHGTGLLGTVVSNSGTDNTVSHEMGHMLLDRGTHNVPDDTYLMHATASNPKKLTPEEIKTIRSSPFVK
ncbi:DUF4157 domain-containing protein [uncultured Aquimarina sp.]|uniref:eCIS core domain-containing protein n=1 Tax=uncultured Aquimarina sp. TaxID=575652 RepID=UPI00261BDD7D|nr:DUF4157 domain-containing protein [uncultured Aquimarina sp.]